VAPIQLDGSWVSSPDDGTNGCERVGKEHDPKLAWAALWLECQPGCDAPQRCESKVTHVYPGDVEHIAPSSVVPQDAFVWTNLTLCCGECNRRKSDYYDPAKPLLNPFADIPEDHLYVWGPYVFGRAPSEKGRLTELMLELNRADLLERRGERVKLLKSFVDQFESEPPSRLKELLKCEVMKDVDLCTEYSLVAEAFVTETRGVQT